MHKALRNACFRGAFFLKTSDAFLSLKCKKALLFLFHCAIFHISAEGDFQKIRVEGGFIKLIRKFREWSSLSITKHTKWFLFLGIVLFNVFFILLASLLLMKLTGNDEFGFFNGVFRTFTMILDAGCIENLVDPDLRNRALAVSCIVVILIGTLTFTGALIGFITNFISGIIENVDAGKRRIIATNHTIILNWNTRASEIINDLLYKEEKQKVVVLVDHGKDEIVKEIDERLTETVRRENREIIRKAEKMNPISQFFYYQTHRFKKNIMVIVREGDVFSTKQLEDISLKHARSIVILGGDINNTVCKFETRERLDLQKKGNALTIKTLMQVADITAANDSNDDQTIVVEITDEWTKDLVNRIIKAKENLGDGEHGAKNHIVPVDVNKTLGQILSQFSLMPELNDVYSNLFSNKGAAFYCSPSKGKEESIEKYLENHFHAIPLTRMEINEKLYRYFVAEKHSDGTLTGRQKVEPINIQMNPSYDNGTKNIVILGHNSKMHEIMEGFESFKREWSSSENKLKITVIDDEDSLEKMNHYENHSFVTTYAADIYEKDRISKKIREIVDSSNTDTSVLILSDDDVLKEDIDANALTNLIYLHDIILEKIQKGKETGIPFDTESIDVIVEIIDPKHHDVVRSYSQNNVVISNRYISKMITQISDSFEIYSFYQDILSYDEIQEFEDETNYESYEIYLKEAVRFFNKIPEKCTAAQLIRAVYEQSVDPEVFKSQLNPTLVLGYVRPHKGMTLFVGNQNDLDVELEPKDKLIVFSLH